MRADLRVGEDPLAAPSPRALGGQSQRRRVDAHDDHAASRDPPGPRPAGTPSGSSPSRTSAARIGLPSLVDQRAARVPRRVAERSSSPGPSATTGITDRGRQAGAARRRRAGDQPAARDSFEARRAACSAHLGGRRSVSRRRSGAPRPSSPAGPASGRRGSARAPSSASAPPSVSASSCVLGSRIEQRDEAEAGEHVEHQQRRDEALGPRGARRLARRGLVAARRCLPAATGRRRAECARARASRSRFADAAAACRARAPRFGRCSLTAAVAGCVGRALAEQPCDQQQRRGREQPRDHALGDRADPPDAPAAAVVGVVGALHVARDRVDLARSRARRGRSAASRMGRCGSPRRSARRRGVQRRHDRAGHDPARALDRVAAGAVQREQLCPFDSEPGSGATVGIAGPPNDAT